MSCGKITKENLNQNLQHSDEWFSDPGDEDELISLDGSDEGVPKHPYFRPESIDIKQYELKVGDKFQNGQEFRKVLRDWSVRKGYSLFFLKNEGSRITVVCEKDTCDWRIHASKILKGPTFQIRTLRGSHNCARSYDNNLTNYKYLAKRMENTIRDNSDIGIEKLQQKIYRKYNLNVNYWTVLRVKRAAIDKIRGCEIAEYELLWDYCETVRNRNPGSKILLRRQEGMNPPTFDKIYYSLDAMKKGFLGGCRPVIGLDGCFLKTSYGGQLLAAVGRDDNDNMWPIALAVVRVENRETWSWFLTELLLDIGAVDECKWTFISDRQKELIDALEEIAPGCEHRFCLRHMYANFKQKYTSLDLKDAFWKAAFTGNKNKHERCMKRMEQLEFSAVEWLRKIPSHHWARSNFKIGCNSDVMVNNLCESFNSYILQARDKPIISMFELIRGKLASRIQSKREGMDKYDGIICPNILRKLEGVYKQSRNCVPRFCGKAELEVQDGISDRYVVDLGNKSCTCGLFQLRGYPCAHAYSAICNKRHKLEEYVNDYFKKEAYLRTYSCMIHGVPGSSDYIKTNYEPLKAPNYKRKRERPKKLRRKGVDEVAVSTRKGLLHHCQNCLQAGHNRKTCKNATHLASNLNKGQSTAEKITCTGNQTVATSRSKELKAKVRQARQRVNARNVGVKMMTPLIPSQTSEPLHSSSRTNDSQFEAREWRANNQEKDGGPSVEHVTKAPRIRKPSISEVFQI